MALTNAERQKRWRDKNPQVEQNRRYQLKNRVLSHYGEGKPKCVICDESRLECLSIDHISGGGNKQRRKSLRSSTAFYHWLETRGYPEGYQTLCMNCQFIKRFQNSEHC
jgi:hypothetical protein